MSISDLEMFDVVLLFTQNCTNISCLMIMCVVGRLDRGQSAVVKIRSRLWVHTFLQVGLILLLRLFLFFPGFIPLFLAFSLFFSVFLLCTKANKGLTLISASLKQQLRKQFHSRVHLEEALGLLVMSCHVMSCPECYLRVKIWNSPFKE